MLVRAHHRTDHLAAFAAGLVFAAVTSAGLIEERASSGSLAIATVTNALVTFGAIALLAQLQRHASSSWGLVLPQIGGALCGIALAHLALRAGVLSAPPWLSERPGQLVNDLVAVFCTLAIVWGCARNLDARLLAGSLLLISAYRATAHAWHLDAAPHGFLFTVQDLVFAQFIAAAFAVAVYRRMTADAE